MGHSAPILGGFETLPDMLTAKDLEALLQIDRKTIFAWAKNGLIPYSRMGSSIRFSKHRVLQWLEERSFEPRPMHGKGSKRE